jgi:hypothetical protein
MATDDANPHDSIKRLVALVLSPHPHCTSPASSLSAISGFGVSPCSSSTILSIFQVFKTSLFKSPHGSSRRFAASPQALTIFLKASTLLQPTSLQATSLQNCGFNAFQIASKSPRISLLGREQEVCLLCISSPPPVSFVPYFIRLDC